MITPANLGRLIFTCLVGMFLPFPAFASDETISRADYAAEVTGFLDREIAAHVSAVNSLNPPQPLVLGVGTKGDFTWGSFMRALTECAATSGQGNIAGRDVPQFLGQLGLIEARQGGKTFAQLGAAIALRQFGADLKTNALWQSLSPAEQTEWRLLLNPERFYDRTNHHVINLPENYFGVASRIVALDFEMGLITDRAFADEILNRAAGQFKAGALYTDDNLPTGRYDRYSQEYARFVYEAAGILGRKDIQATVAPALKAVMHTWWDLAGPDGCGYPWGRTIGAISYMDTMEICGFLAQYPQFRPAPLADLAAMHHAAWRWLQHDYQPDRHLLNMFAFGRGNFSYMSPERQWQQTTAFLAKAADSFRKLQAALDAENSPPSPPGRTCPRWRALIFPSRRTPRRRVARARGPVALRPAPHHRHAAGHCGLSARAARAPGLCRAGGAIRPRPRAVSRTGRWPDHRRGQRRG